MKWLAIIVGTLAVMYAAYNVSYPTYTHRYRLTIEIETPEGARSGSSVIEVTTRPLSGPLGQLFPSSGAPHAKGEAVFVDLGQGRNLVALLAFGPDARGPHSMSSLAFEVFRVELTRMAHLTGRAELSGDLIPTLVTFKDAQDPKSVWVISSSEFLAVFGPGVRVRRVSIEMTRDGVTTGITQKLPWLADMERRGLGSTINARPGVFTINVPYFKKGV